MYMLAAAFLTFGRVTPPVADLGINCRGSISCGDDDAANILVSYIETISDGTWYNNGQHIACYFNICAFLQNTGGTTGAVIKQLAPYIPGHKCKECGSVPYYYPQGDNNVADGELTFDYVSDACDTGLC
ncbi:killer toxin [Mycena leptocephala]|nr:killer toxin [Mycena leptocephala]